MSIGAYGRISSSSQKMDSQEAEIKNYLQGNGIDPALVTWYLDTETGKTLDRPALNRLQKDIFAGKIKTVIIWKLDRLSRRLRDGVNTLADWCDRGIRVVVVTQQIDLSGSVGRMIAAVMLGLSEIELELRRERQEVGIKVAKAKGAYKGRMQGTTKAKPQRAKELHAQGLKVPEIAMALGASPRTVWRYLGVNGEVISSKGEALKKNI